MKTPRNEMTREYYINSDVRDNPHYYNMMIPQGREPFHPHKLTTGSFYDGRHLENKDRGLTNPSGCAPVDAPPC